MADVRTIGDGASSERPVEPAAASPEASGVGPSLESGTYEILRNRLLAHGKVLRERLEKLNAARREVFGSIEFALKATERVTTENNCVPRDMVAFGADRFLFGYNVRIGLKTETNLEDVFSILEYRDGKFRAHDLSALREADGGAEFERDFRETYRYYRDARFVKFHTIGPDLYFVLRIGKDARDIKTFKWTVDGGKPHYHGNRFDHEFKFPLQHEFEWKRATRSHHRAGQFPHISIEDRVFVECVGGDMTIKVEDNTATGEGIYSEPVEHKDQTLNDAEIFHASLKNLILLKVKPFQEKKFRYFVYAEKVKQVRRIDQIEETCIKLPDDHGIIFHNGYFLQSGEFKVFENELSNMSFADRIEATNGEDYCYVFHNLETGTYILMSYNRIEQQLKTPIICSGFTVFDSGELVLFPCDDEPKKHHALQIWQTPYIGKNVIPTAAKTDAFLYKIGNQDVVGCMAECHEIVNLLGKDDTYQGLYLDLVKKSAAIVDAYFWIGDPQAFEIRKPLLEIGAAARAAIEEFEKVAKIRKNTGTELERLKARVGEIIGAVDYHKLESIDVFVGHLSSLRAIRGEIISARELRYVDIALLDELEKAAVEHTDRLSQLCVGFLLQPVALEPYRTRVEEQRAAIEKVLKVTEANTLGEEIEKSGAELEMLIEIVSNLKIEDATESTRIIDNISEIYATLNQVKSTLKNRRKDLQAVEGTAQFGAQLKLLSQAVTNYLDLCDTARKCDEFLTKTMVQLEELEGRFADFEEFVHKLGEKREEIYTAFSAKKLQITEARNKRAAALYATAERLLNGIKSRAGGIRTIEELNGYFASDLMIDKLRGTVSQLVEMEDTVRADEVQSRLKTLQQDAVRTLKDRLELYVDGQNVIQLGANRFSVNTQPLEVTMVLRDAEMHYHLTGTNYFEKVEDADFLATRATWNQEVVSENAEVYRAEYLAFLVLRHLDADRADLLEKAVAMTSEDRLEWVRQYMATRYTEGYVKGVHDHDAAAILARLLPMHEAVGQLKFSPDARAAARVFWNEWRDEGEKRIVDAKLKSFGAMIRFFEEQEDRVAYLDEIRGHMRGFLGSGAWFDATLVEEAAAYLFHELATREKFVISRGASEMAKEFLAHLRKAGAAAEYEAARKSVAASRRAELDVIRDWLDGYLDATPGHDRRYLEEASALLFYGVNDSSQTMDVELATTVEKMVGAHAVIAEGRYRLDYYAFVARLKRYAAEIVPAFEKYTEKKNELLARKRRELKLDEFQTRVLSTFVRNRLIDEFYLPLVGANMAKQLGVAGAAKRTDRMGLLLMISPPGYGKTTLVEYIASRLGLVFIKINGPALGHRVTSLDPDEATNAAAKEEVKKLNLALEMGDNVMIVVDDIQHCSSEFLQKFISLCDAQRRIEGVWRGKSRTYDLRGRKVMVVMAGNPYTESGEKFRIPDMLANRADTYNLGDVAGANEAIFKMSYLENAVTSNPFLARLSQKSHKDAQAVIRLAESGGAETVDFEGQYSPEEVSEMAAVMKHLIRIRETVLAINRQYIYSASQADAYRAEPAFKMQGSYRNMNRLAEKVVPIMNEDEIVAILHDHYRNESQTLTTGAESNWLKFRELCGTITPEERERWEEIKRTFKRNLQLGAVDQSDPVGKVVAQLVSFREGLEEIRRTISSAATSNASSADRTGEAIAAAAAAAEAAARTSDAVTAAVAKIADAGAGPTPGHAAPTALPPAISIPDRIEAGFSAEAMSTLRDLVHEWSRLAYMMRPSPPPAPEIADAEAAPLGFGGGAQTVSQTQRADPEKDGLAIHGEYAIEFVVPPGQTLSFPPYTVTITGRGFDPNAYLYIYNPGGPVAVRRRQRALYDFETPRELRGILETGEEEVSFDVVSPGEARITFRWSDVANISLGAPAVERRRFTVVNPNGKYASYSTLNLTVKPTESAAPSAPAPTVPPRKRRG